MSERPPIDPETAERLLGGAPVPEHAALRRLLGSVTGPGTAAELAGEEAAVAAFRATGGASPLRSALAGLARLMTFKTVAAVCAAGLAGGAALAAGTGHLPIGPGPGEPDDRRSRPQVVSPAAPGAGGPGAGARTRSARSLVGECRSYTADGDGALGEPRYAGLVSAAGGRSKVPDYCADLLSRQPADTPRPSGVPTGPDAPGPRTPAPPAAPGPPDGAGVPGRPENPGPPGNPGEPTSQPGRPDAPDRTGVSGRLGRVPGAPTPARGSRG